MNFIITGGSGFIGTHLAKMINSLYPDDKVWNFDITSPEEHISENPEYYSPLKPTEKIKATFIRTDVRKTIANLPFTPNSDDVIFNFAAIHRTPGHRDKEYFDTNVNGAQNVCDFARKWNIRKIIFTSSIDIYGAGEYRKDESTAPIPRTPYGQSKLEAEEIHRKWQKEKPNERQLVIVRPGVVFGKGENGNFTRLYQGIRKHRFAYPGRKDTIKACIYVKDLVGFLLYISSQHTPGIELFNCCYEPSLSIEQIVDTMHNITNLSGQVHNIPNYIIMPLAYVAKGLGSPFGICPARVRKLQVSTNVSGKKMTESGYPFKYTFEEAIRDWFYENNNCFLQ